MSQQVFELYAAPVVYASGLVRAATVLRAIIFFDDLFIAAYVTSTILFLRWLAMREAGPLRSYALAAVLLVAGLDLLENHHILTMLRAAEHGVLPTSNEISTQMLASSSKWILGHIAFAMIGLTLRTRGAAARAFRLALIGVQLPLGVLAWTQTDATSALIIEWARYGNLLLGFGFVAWLMTRDTSLMRVDAAVGSGVPA